MGTEVSVQNYRDHLDISSNTVKLPCNMQRARRRCCLCKAHGMLGVCVAAAGRLAKRCAQRPRGLLSEEARLHPPKGGFCFRGRTVIIKKTDT